MAFRDLLIIAALLVVVPMIFMRPHVGVIVWVWSAMMVPNNLLWGFAASLRFNLIFAVATLVAWFVSKEPKKISNNGSLLLVLFFFLWLFLSTLTGLAPEESRLWGATNLIKVFIFAVAISGLVTTRLRVHCLLLGIALGMGYHGFSEGTKFILSGANHKVFGPAGSIIGDNNHFALAMIFLLPLIYYLYTYSTNLLVRYGLLCAFGIIFASVIGTFSRGGLIALAAVGMFGLFKSKNKFAVVVALALGAGFVIYFAPEHWFSRMETIQEAEKDGSFMGRVIAWKISFLLALDHPILGGGIYSIQNLPTWLYYSARFDLLSFIPTPPPDPVKAHSAHSMYFQVLADAGFVGLGIFLLILGTAWLNCNSLIKQSAKLPALEWIAGPGTIYQGQLSSLLGRRCGAQHGVF